MAYSSLTVANAFLALSKRDNKPLSNMKLQKLLYFADGHYLSIRGKPLISDEVEAWEYGPVYEDVYQNFKHYGAEPITGSIKMLFQRRDDISPLNLLEEEDLEFVEAVWKAYSDLTAIRLSEMTHVRNGPWSESYSSGARGQIISKEAIKQYFSSLKTE